MIKIPFKAFISTSDLKSGIFYRIMFQDLYDHPGVGRIILFVGRVAVFCFGGRARRFIEVVLPQNKKNPPDRAIRWGRVDLSII